MKLILIPCILLLPFLLAGCIVDTLPCNCTNQSVFCTNETVYINNTVIINNTIIEYRNQTVIEYVDRIIYKQPESYINVTIKSIECDRNALVTMSYDSNEHVYFISYSNPYNASKKYNSSCACGYYNKTI